MSDGMGREPAYLSSHATNRYFIPNWGINTSIFVKPEVSVLSGGASTSDEISACINAQENEKKDGESPKRGTSVAEER